MPVGNDADVTLLPTPEQRIEVYNRINELEKSRIETDEFVKYSELYGGWLLWALVLLVAEFVVRRLWLNTIP
jgi:Ca-activated chloride channel family protein